jgi:hypothetical protein
MSARFLGLLVLNFLIAVTSWANSTDTLPAGINNTSFRIGSILGLDQRFSSDGSLWRLGDYKSVQFTSENLSHFNSRAQQLIQALNNFGSQSLGNNLNFGILKVNTAPVVNYFAPVYARGITDRWTIGFGVPIINYKNSISLTQEGSNLAYYRNQLLGLSPELDAALNVDLINVTQATLQERGYRPIQNHDETFIGDIQLASLYRLFGNKWSEVQYSAIFNLPTGPKYNPDDLGAMNVFGRTSIENKFLWSKMLSRSFEMAPYVSHIFNIEDSVTARVPTNANDLLPDQNSKEDVHRKIGDSVAVGVAATLNLDDNFSFGGGYAFTNKMQDSYSGTQGRRYDLLGQDTNSKSQQVGVHVSYSTVKTYMKKQSYMPGIISYNYKDVIAGNNIERRTINEMTFMMFF